MNIKENLFYATSSADIADDWICICISRWLSIYLHTVYTYVTRPALKDASNVSSF